ncbi:MAG: ferric iron uptake transcriptional regulator [Immundisolibacterales bacterium]|nr:ferric iron uptake transcriptional regulator [Immundisolibacterales bacterium]
MQSADLKRAGLKATLPRLRILEILEDSSDLHVTAEDVYGRLRAGGESIGLATVYRVLTQFEQAGLVIRHNFDGGSAVFELAAGEHHDHLVCVRCSRVTEFVDETIERRQRKIAADAGFSMTDHSLIIYGVCTDCQRDSD